MAKLIYKSEEEKEEVSILLKNDPDIYEFFDIIERLTFAIGYSKNSWIDALLNRIEELKLEEKVDQNVK